MLAAGVRLAALVRLGCAVTPALGVRLAHHGVKLDRGVWLGRGVKLGRGVWLGRGVKLGRGVFVTVGVREG